MNRYPEYAEIEGKKYKINTDFRYAIECNSIATDESIGDLERALGVIYVLFGEEGLNTPEHHQKLLKVAKKYLSCNKEIEVSDEKPDMDFKEDYDYIETSFMSDYRISLENTEMHWWKFMNLMNGLSNSELGNCCILNRIRNLRNYDLKDVKDPKERERIKKAQETFGLKKQQKKPTKEQRESMESLLEQLGIRKE